MPEKGGFPHYMLKEIHEQPHGLRETLLPRLSSGRDRIVLPGIGLSEDAFRRLRRIKIAGSGTSRHAGLAGAYMIEQLARVPVDVDHASEFAYRDPIIGPDELTIAITQSGETADTLKALREAKSHGSWTMAIANVIDSTIAREADGVLYTYAGREVSIASTKAFTAQLAILYLIGLYLAQVRQTVDDGTLRRHIAALEEIPAKVEAVLKADPVCRELAERYHDATDFLYLGRGVHYAAALDGALKLKEVSYIHAKAYPSGEAKHGPNALIDGNLPVVILATRDPNDAGSMVRHERSLANLKEIKARSGRVIAVVNEDDDVARQASDQAILVPAAPELLLPILEIVPLQLLAYHIAVRRGLDVDRPRNLAKAVLVE